MCVNAKGYVIYTTKPRWEVHNPNLSNYCCEFLIHLLIYLKQSNDWNKTTNIAKIKKKR